MAETSRLLEVIEVFERWLHLPDPCALYAMLGAVAANMLEGDPVWLLLVGPPGGGKSELLASLGGLPNTHPCATLTEAALLSGSPKREHATDAKGGLLHTIGGFGIIVCKDFGSVLSMNRDARALVLAALREVYDGSWTRHVGTDGGKTLHWQGKVGLVGGCTPTIDRHHAVMGAMGERFLLFRLPQTDATVLGHQALAHAGRETSMRAELSQAVRQLFADSQLVAHERTSDESEALVALATLVARARSAVERDGYSRDIELIPEPEAPTRLVVMLDRLLVGLRAIGLDSQTAWKIVTKAGLDSLPALRLDVLNVLRDGPQATPKIGEAVGYPKATVKRTIEDLAAHGLVERNAQGAGSAADVWELSEWTAGRLRVCVPEKSSNTLNEKEKEANGPDKSGTQPRPPDVSGTQSSGPDRLFEAE